MLDCQILQKLVYMDHNNYVARLQAGAQRISECSNLPVTDLYYDSDMNIEMERLFGFPVYEEHKAIVNRCRKFGKAVSPQACTANQLTSILPDLRLYFKQPSFLHPHGYASALEIDLQKFSGSGQDLLRLGNGIRSSTQFLSHNGTVFLQPHEYRYYAINLIQQEFKKLHGTEQSEPARALNSKMSQSYSTILQKYKRREEAFENTHRSFDRNAATYKALKDPSKLFQRSLEDSTVDEISDTVARFALNLPETSHAFSRNMAKKIALKKNMRCKFCHASKKRTKVYRNQGLENGDSNTVFLKLRKLICSNCGTTGDVARTYKCYLQNDFDLTDENSSED